MHEELDVFYNDNRECPFEQVDVIGQGLGVVEEVMGKEGQVEYENRTFARKTIRIPSQEDSGRQDALVKIRNEVKNLKDAQHFHTVRLVMAYVTKLNYAIVMDPRADQDLEQVFTTNAGEARGEIPKWFGCLLNALAFIHGKQIKHRDIKPQNLLVKGKNILISDFGISLRSPGKTVPTTLENSPRARTREYCSPDVEDGHTRGSPADVFALGAVFLEMLTVCAFSDPEAKVMALREKLKTADGFSFARGMKEVGSWIERIGESPSKLPWHDTIGDFCKDMLQEERCKRPTAEDLYSRWNEWTEAEIPGLKSACECHPKKETSDSKQPE